MAPSCATVARMFLTESTAPENDFCIPWAPAPNLVVLAVSDAVAATTESIGSTALSTREQMPSLAQLGLPLVKSRKGSIYPETWDTLSCSAFIPECMSPMPPLSSPSPFTPPARPFCSWAIAPENWLSVADSLSTAPSRWLIWAVPSSSWSAIIPACSVRAACSGMVPAGREADCTIRIPGISMRPLVTRSTAMTPAGVRRSWSDSIDTISGNSRFGGKCRSMA
ncbi:Uncharacterised protein [Mycobacteroides abscessus]|nr:Uncharacterised protein [Mycobacteroides abscessus]